MEFLVKKALREHAREIAKPIAAQIRLVLADLYHGDGDE